MGRRLLRVLTRVWDLEGLVGMEVGRSDVPRNCRARRINELEVEWMLKWLLLAYIFLLVYLVWSFGLGRFRLGYFLIDDIFSPTQLCFCFIPPLFIH
jgi:hypothetical protein